MKTKFDVIKHLSRQDIIVGIIACYENSSNLYKSALILKRNKRYNVATSILTLSIEELMKGLGLFNLLIFESEDKDFMKEIFESRDLHSSKLEFALIMTHVFKQFNGKRLSKIKIDTPEDLANYLQKILFIDEIENEKKILNNWFKQANERKNAGLYVAYNKKWFTPNRIGEKEFIIALGETKTIRKFTSFLFKEFIEMDKEFIDYAIHFWRNMAIILKNRN